MKTYLLRNTDLVVSRLAYGCASLGGWERGTAKAETLSKATRAVQAAIEAGITLFDHADVYGFGKSEEIFGEVLKGSPGLRERLVLQTKCGQRFQNEPHSGDPFRADCSYEHIVRSAEASLRRLHTDRLDIFLLHSPDALADPDEIAQAFESLHRSGKVRYFGVSNHTMASIELLRRTVRQPLIANQIPLSLARPTLFADSLEAYRDDKMRITPGDRNAAGIVDYSRLHDIRIQAYSPLRGQLLNPPPDAASEIKSAHKTLASLAWKKNVAPSAVAVAWLLRHPAGVIPIIGSTTPEHIAENCEADRVTLSREEWYSLLATAAGVPSARLLGIPERFAEMLADP